MRKNVLSAFISRYVYINMLFINDFREKKILLIRNEEKEGKIRFQNDNIVFEKEGKVVNQMSCHKVLSIFIVGETTISSVLIRNATDFGISIFLLKHNLDNYAYIGSKAEGNYMLRMRQYERTPGEELVMAKNVIANKLVNQLKLIKSVNKAFPYVKEKKVIIERVEAVLDDKELLGVEGNYSKIFFQEYFKDLKWYKRMPRVKIDEYNILLDIGYTFLFNYIDSLLMLYGFDTYKGFYHKLFFQRKSLPCDIIEPFRCLIERQLLKSFNLGQIDMSDFKRTKGVYRLDYIHSKKYTNIFLNCIIDNREEIYKYIYSFYRYQESPDNNKFPVFTIR